MEFYDYAGIQLTVDPPYEGKKWTLFGDSLTDEYGGKDWNEYKGTDRYAEGDARCWDGYKFASRIGREFGLTIDNRAHSGSNIYYTEDGTYSDYNGINMLNALIAEIEAGTTECPDYITVAFGSNQNLSYVGTVEDTSETYTTAYGATKYFVEKLRYLQETYNQQLVFGFVLPPQTVWNGSAERASKGREAIKAVLDTEEYTTPYVDMWTESGISHSMLPDGVHISSERTNNLYYHAMRRFMMGL
jgi:lysophospholipase L1-like esterase